MGFQEPRGTCKDYIKTDVKVILCDAVDSVLLAQNLYQSSAVVKILKNMQVL